MTRRREVLDRLTGLVEVRDIVDAMKTLSFIETRRIADRLENERQVVEAIEGAAGDMLAVHANLLRPRGEPPRLWVVVGSERGFCGDFNEQVIDRLAVDIDAHAPGARPDLIAVGDRLGSRLERDPRVAERLQGASVADEVDTTLGRIVAALGARRDARGPPAVRVVWQDPASDAPGAMALLPAFDDLQSRARAAGSVQPPPLTHLSADALMLGLADQYLFAVLRRVLDSALLAEHQRRVAHLEAAGHHIEARVEALQRRANQLRQEEIIEEIEVILLSGATQAP